MAASMQSSPQVEPKQSPDAKSRPSRWWYALLLPPFAGLLFPGFYARSQPPFAGFPFFYWYQFSWVIISALLTGFVYSRIRERK
jgi:hypothetical protein